MLLLPVMSSAENLSFLLPYLEKKWAHVSIFVQRSARGTGNSWCQRRCRGRDAAAAVCEEVWQQSGPEAFRKSTYPEGKVFWKVRRILTNALTSMACSIPLIFLLMSSGGISQRWCAASSWCWGQKEHFEWKLNRNSVCCHAEHGIGWLHKSKCQLTRKFYQMELWCFSSMLSTHEKNRINWRGVKLCMSSLKQKIKNIQSSSQRFMETCKVVVL